MEPSDPRRLSQQQQPHHHHHVIFCPHHHHCQHHYHHHHHHHHHHHYMVLCPNHHHHHHPLLLSSSFSQKPEARGAVPADNQFESEPAAVISEAHPFGKLLEDGEDVVEEVAEEEEEEEDPIFVLTDEWREYFAKSEAKRRLAKKMAKKGRK